MEIKMEMHNKVLINDLASVNGLCRVCLTESKMMIPLDNKVEQSEQNVTTIWQLLCRVTCIEITTNERYPSFICPMCMSMLKITYQFKLQFETSQKLLGEYFGEHLIQQTVSSVIEVVQEGQYEIAPVELISKQGKYDLKDVFIVENENEEKPNYSGFLSNLGKEVSASFAKEKMANRNNTSVSDNAVTIIKLNDSSESTIKMHPNKDDLKLECSIDDAAGNNGYLEEGPAWPDICDDMNESDKKMNSRMSRCSVCQKVFANRKYLKLHVERIHLHKKQTFVCEVCGVLLKSRSSHYHHMLKHDGKRHKCSYCQKMYFNSSTLRQHVTAVHKNERLHLCTICGKSFNYSNALDYHMRIHTDEKKYKCSYCDKTFRMQCGLNRHLRVHTGIRPYKCKFCEKAFRSKGELDCHEMIHTGYRPYHCKYCGKGFTKTYNLKMHLLGHSGRHACEVCNKTFIECDFLKIHMRSSHSIKEEDCSDKES